MLTSRKSGAATIFALLPANEVCDATAVVVRLSLILNCIPEKGNHNFLELNSTE